MELIDQVCSFQQANEIAGYVKLETHFSYIIFESEDEDSAKLVTTFEANNAPGDYIVIPAPNVAELGILLGPYQVFYRREPEIDENYWGIYYDYNLPIVWLPGEFDDKPEAQARADALIWLVENDKADDLGL